MKKHLKLLKRVRITALILTCITLLVPAMPTANALSKMSRTSFAALGEGLTLHRNVFETSDMQAENYFTYYPNTTISPVVVYGSKVCNYGNFPTMASLLTKKGWNVVGGINGDFYSLASYEPVGIVITDGLLRSSDNGFYAMGFKADGSAFIGKPTLEMRIRMGTENYRLGGINKLRDSDNYFLFSEDFSYTTKNSEPGRDVILRLLTPEESGTAEIPGKDSAKLTVNCSLSFAVEQILVSDDELTLPDGKFVLSLSKKADEWRQYGLNNLKVGDIVTLEVTAPEQWNLAEYAIGSYVKLVTDSKKDPSIPDTLTDRGMHPRSAAGIRSDGSVILYTVDGRQSGYSSGLTTEQVAERLIELGCTDAILLDGGGSTNIHALYIGSPEPSQINSPSDGRERSVTNYIMLAAKGTPSGTVRNIGVFPYSAYVLANSEVRFLAAASDETCRAVKTPDNLSWSVSGDGSVDASGYFSAPAYNTELTLSANYGNVRGSASVRVVEQPSSVTVKNAVTGREIGTLGVIAGETVQLSASAELGGVELLCSNGAFVWETTGGVGEIDQNGVFTASHSQGNGFITARAGDTTASVEVTIRSETEMLEDFESDDISFASGSSVAVSREENRDFVRLGKFSARIDYDASEGYAYFDASLSPGEKMNYISLWVYGDASGSNLAVCYEDGSVSDITVLDFTGWRQIVAALPVRGIDIMGFTVGGTYNYGTFWIDGIVASTSPEPDDNAPDLELTVHSDGTVTGFVMDAVCGVPDKSAVELLFDGEPLPFTLNSATGKISAVLEGETRETGNESEEGASPEFYLPGVHSLTLRARDTSGNISSVSELLVADAVSPFDDMDSHWSLDYVSYIYSLGITSGIETDSGFVYLPDNNISRAQFAVMMARYLKLDLSLYTDYTLEFEDTYLIPDYALDSVKAVCALGIIKGLYNNGALVFEPDSPLTRAQAMTVIGRSQPGGYADPPLEFTDAYDVPDWAESYVRSLTAQEVIGGFEDGSLRPLGSLTRAQIAKIITAIA